MNTPCGWNRPHDPHSWEDVEHHGIMEWCPGWPEADDSDHALLDALRRAEAGNTQARPCQVCAVLASMSEPVAKALRSGLAGTIGRDKLVAVLNNHGYTVGRRAIERHRQEGHS